MFKQHFKLNLIHMPAVKFSLLIVFLFTFLFSQAQQHSLTQLWESDSSLKVPESVLYDETGKLLYISNIDGASGEKDGKGSIGKMALDGKIIQADWVSGLHAPKGMAKSGNTLYVADVDAVAVIDIKKGAIVKRIPVEGAVFLNDITIDKKGIVYVSDTRAKKVHRIQNGKVSLHLDNLQSPNGLLIHGGKLYVLDNGGLYRQDNNGLTKLADGMEPSTDGLENVQGNEFIVSSWIGAVYYVKEDGSKETLLETKDKKINTADIGYDAKRRIVYVPTFFRNTVVAYELK
jgi:hypothetical protein